MLVIGAHEDVSPVERWAAGIMVGERATGAS